MRSPNLEKEEIEIIETLLMHEKNASMPLLLAHLSVFNR